MPKKTKVEIVQSVLSQMNLTPDENNPQKKPFVDDSELAAHLKIEKTTVYNTRRSLKFARANGVNENCHVVYAWRWAGDDRYAKIGNSPIGMLLYRTITTYEPIDDPLLIGVRVCRNAKEAREIEKDILNNKLERTRDDREWVIMNKDFDKMIDREFTRIEKIAK